MKVGQFIALALVPIFLASCVTAKNVTIVSSEPEAKIYVNDQYSGKGTATVEAKGGDLDVRMVHPDYGDFQATIKPTQRALNEIAFYTGLPLFGVGTLVAISTLMISLVVPKKELNGLDLTPLTIGGAIAGATGIGLTVAGMEAKTYPSPVAFDMSSLSFYDADGYNKQTGLDHWGVDRQGRFLDGSRFSGTVVKGKKTGYGQFDYPPLNTTYVGTFVDDLATGLLYQYPLGTVDISKLMGLGMCVKGQLQGFTVTFSENTVPRVVSYYENNNLIRKTDYPRTPPVKSAELLIYLSDQLKGDLADGEGDAISLDGKTRWTGRFEAGELLEGRMITPDGSVIAGRFSHGQLVEGRITLPNGNSQEGTWENGTLHSPGRLLFADGRRYDGELSNGRFNGKGTLILANGDIYRGDFVDGVYSGSGTYSFASGSTYTGQFANGTFEGSGKLVKSNGETFEGSFAAGLPHGNGIYKYQGEVERAEYYEGKRIDQVYLIRAEREKDRIEKARQQEAAEQARLAAERAQREAEAAARQRQAEEEQRRGIFALVGGLATVALGSQVGLSDDASLSLGVAAAKDIYSGDSSASNTKETADAILQRRQQQAASGAGATAQFAEKPAAAPSTDTSPASATAGAQGSASVGTRAATQTASGDQGKTPTKTPQSKPSAAAKPAGKPAYAFVFKTDKGVWFGEGPFTGKTSGYKTKQEVIALVLSSQWGSTRSVVREIPLSGEGASGGGILLLLSDPPLMDKEKDIAAAHGYIP